MGKGFSYCKIQIEGGKICKEQCDHCKEYYASLEKDKTSYWNEPELILNTNSHFGAQLKVFRLQKGLKQVTLAKKMGCTPDNIGHFEKGDNTFGNGSLTTVFKYARALGFTEIKFKL